MSKEKCRKEKHRQIKFEAFSKQTSGHEGNNQPQLLSYLPNGSRITNITVHRGKIIKRFYTTPQGNVISFYPNPIHESLLFSSDVA